MKQFDLTFKSIGRQAVLIEWPNRIDENILDDIIQFTNLIIVEEKGKLTNYTPGYNSLLLQYNSTIDLKQLKNLLLNLYISPSVKLEHRPKTWQVPVCYHEEYGLDLSSFADKGLSVKEVEQLHTSNPYRVFMIGFLPGFLYLGGLPSQLYMNRKENPRPHIPKGSIAIGGKQTGIYPMDSPGGWQIIGRTPLSLFDISKEDPSPIKQGDYIQFYSIRKSAFQTFLTH